MAVVNYILALKLYIRRRVERSRGRVVAVRIRDVCVDDKRCEQIVVAVLKKLEREDVVQKRKQGVYLVDKSTLDRL
jgi:hypothetical protein